MLAHVVATDDLVANDGIETAILKIHECRNVVGVLLDLLDFLLVEIRGVHVLLCRARALCADGLAREALFIRDGGRALLHEDDLAVVHVGLGEEHVLLALLGDVQPVPEDLDASALELRLLARPVDCLELNLAAKTLRGLLCQVNIKARDLTAFILKAHRREIIVESDDDLALVCAFVRRGRLVSAAARAQRCRAGKDCRARQDFFPVHCSISP